MKRFLMVGLVLAVLLAFVLLLGLIWGVWHWVTWPPNSTENHLVQNARAGDLAAVKRLVAAGADLEKPAKWRPWGGNAWIDGRTPLTAAVEARRLPVAEWLIQAGANVDGHDGYGQTPLHVAAQNGDFDMAELLVRRGSDVRLMQKGSNYYYNALSNAARAENGMPLVRLLLEHGALLDNPDHIRRHVIDAVARTNDQELIEMLARATPAKEKPRDPQNPL